MAQRYSADFRRGAVRSVHTGNLSVAAAAKNLGIAPSTLRSWLAAGSVGERYMYQRGGRAMVNLRRRNRELETENALLRQVMAYLAARMVAV